MGMNWAQEHCRFAVLAWECNRKIGYCPGTLPAGILQYYGNVTGKLNTAPGPCLQESCSIMGMQQEINFKSIFLAFIWPFWRFG